MHYVNIRALQHFPEILISFDSRAPDLQRLFQMILIDIAHCQESGSGVIQVPSPHAANSDDCLGQLVTRCCVSLPSKDRTRNDCERCRGSKGSFDEISAGYCFFTLHISLLYLEFTVEVILPRVDCPIFRRSIIH